MLKVLCKYAKIIDIPNLQSRSYYQEMIKPLDYDFYLNVGSCYDILGLIARSGVPWLYVIRHDEDYNVDILPAILFDYSWNKIPSNWVMRINGPSNEDIELLPKSLSLMEHWYERYIDEDVNVLEVVKDVINNICMRDG